MVIEAGWYPGEDWTALQVEAGKWMPQIGYFVALYIQIGKAAICIAWDWN